MGGAKWLLLQPAKVSSGPDETQGKGGHHTAETFSEITCCQVMMVRVSALWEAEG